MSPISALKANRRQLYRNRNAAPFSKSRARLQILAEII